MSDHKYSPGDGGGPDGAAGRHLSEEEAEAYYFNKPSLEEESPVRDHLVSCKECAALVLDIAAFYGADAAAASRPAEAEVKAAWERLRPSLPAPQPRAARGPRPSLAAAWAWLGGLNPSARWAYASAALLFVISVALAALLASALGDRRELNARLSEEREARLRSDPRAEEAEERRAEEVQAARESSVEERARSDAERASAEEGRARAALFEARVKQLEEQLAEARREGVRPSRAVGPGAGLWTNAPIRLLAMSRVRDGVEEPGDALTVRLPPGTDLFTFVFQDPAPEKGYAKYGVEIEDAGGRVWVKEEGLRGDSAENGRFLTLAVRRRRLPAGQYRIKLFGLKDGERKEEGVRDILLKY